MTHDIVEFRPGSQRERAKSGRRRRIVRAAYDLLREMALEEVSGRLIAARAGVSLSTVYNLFGSKDAVLVAVLDEDFVRYEALIVALPPRAPLDRFFQAIDVAIDLYRKDPAFYRAIMWRAPAPHQALTEALRRPRIRFWESLVRAAIDAGALRADAHAATLSALLIRQFSAAVWDWIAEDISLDQFATEAKLGFAATLLPFAAKLETPRLKAQLLQLQKEAATMRKAVDQARAGSGDGVMPGV